MRVNLKGVHRVRKKLATGLYATYYYAWRGGPRIDAKFGTPEFHQAYVTAHATRSNQPIDTLNAVFRAFGHSSDFTLLAPRTDDKKHLRFIEAELGDFPTGTLGGFTTDDDIRKPTSLSSPRSVNSVPGR